VIDFDGDWVVNDRTHNEFLDRCQEALARALGWPAGEPPPPEWLSFRRLTLTREQAGRDEFGFAYLGRDNIQAGAEEATDGCNYTYFETRKSIRAGRDADWDLALTAAYHDYMAYLTRLQMRSRQRGDP
jgi:hypothetical protein